MKTKLLFLGMLCFNLSFGQQSQSFNSVQTGITPVTPIAPNEIFRFQSGNVTQLDAGTGFGFTSTNRWFSLGKVVTGVNTAYGLRFQSGAKAVTFGYEDIANPNPRIQWIGTGLGLGDFEFRVADNFNSTNSTLVATMTKEGNTFFGIDQSVLGATAKVNISHSQAMGLNIENKFIQTVSDATGFKVSAATGINTNTGGEILTEKATQENTGLRLLTRDGKTAIGVRSTALASTLSGLSSAYGIFGETIGINSFEAAIYGKTPSSFSNRYAGFFDGATFSTTGWGPSDAKLKENVKQETNVLERLSKLNAVTYDYKKMSELNLPIGLQHGFIAQELAEIFPELTQDIIKPVFDEQGKAVSTFEFKAVNYNGLISVLTAAVNELHSEMKLLKEEVEELRNSTTSEKNIENSTNKIVLEQNIPNPFNNQTTIKYQLPQGTSKASLLIFDLNGTLKKEFPLTENKSEITVSASQIGKGLFIYSLVQNGQLLVTKKMIVL